MKNLSCINNYVQVERNVQAQSRNEFSSRQITSRDHQKIQRSLGGGLSYDK